MREIGPMGRSGRLNGFSMLNHHWHIPTYTVCGTGKQQALPYDGIV